MLSGALNRFFIFRFNFALSMKDLTYSDGKIAEEQQLEEEDELDLEIYTFCRCDPSRRKETSSDSWTLWCGKCIVCGDLGHFRHMPRSFVRYEAGFCEFHYKFLSGIKEKQLVNAFRICKNDPFRVAIFLCGNTMNKYKIRRRDNFIHSKKDASFYDRLQRLRNTGTARALHRFMACFPDDIPFDDVIYLKNYYLR